MSKHPPNRTPEADFLGSDGGEGEAEAAEGLTLLVDATLRDVSPPEGLGARLAREVSELPLCYAPFFDRLGALWDLPEAGVVSELTRAKNPREWGPTLFRGVRSFVVQPGRNAPRSGVKQTRRLLRLQPGVVLPQHRHSGREHTLVLEGGYRDSHGDAFGPGEEQRMEAGSSHELRVDADGVCVVAYVEEGLEFEARLLQLFNRIFG